MLYKEYKIKSEHEKELLLQKQRQKEKEQILKQVKWLYPHLYEQIVSLLENLETVEGIIYVKDPDRFVSLLSRSPSVKWVNPELEGVTSKEFEEYYFEINQCYAAQAYSTYHLTYAKTNGWIKKYWLYVPPDYVVKPPVFHQLKMDIAYWFKLIWDTLRDWNNGF